VKQRLPANGPVKKGRRVGSVKLHVCPPRRLHDPLTEPRGGIIKKPLIPHSTGLPVPAARLARWAVSRRFDFPKRH